MRHRLLVVTGALALIVLPLAGQAPSSSTRASFATKSGTVPRTADGHPELQGIWTNATITPIERPAMFPGKLTVSDEDAAKYETQNNDNLYGDRRSSNAEQDRDHAYNSLFFDRGTELARVDGVKRTSLIIDPPDGKVPPMTPEAQKRAGSRLRGLQRFDRPQDRPLGERCLLGFGSTSGPPMMPVLYNNNYQIVQTSGAVVILNEMIHNVRIIPLDGRPHVPQSIRQWEGDSVGHWEGNTLVIDTTNFTDQIPFKGAQNLHVIERLTRADEDTIVYQFTVEDPGMWTKEWSGELPITKIDGQLYEYACHEANYPLANTLRGARVAEAETAKKSAK